jgi:hypothetical protein
MKNDFAVIAIFNREIQWPPTCVQCNVRQASTNVRIKGRYLLSGNLYAPHCVECAESRHAVFRHAIRFVGVGLLPFVLFGPVALYEGGKHLYAPSTAPALLALSIGLVVWFGLSILTLFLVLRAESRRLGQVAILMPIVVYRTFDAPLPGKRCYRLGLRSTGLSEFLQQNNQSTLA